jgi:hypothetical protein
MPTLKGQYRRLTAVALYPTWGAAVLGNRGFRGNDPMAVAEGPGRERYDGVTSRAPQ